MSWSLEVRNGDLTVGNARLGEVKGHKKLIQDLAHWLLEPMGNDNLHPGYGSIIDGGLQNGVEKPSMIGLTDSPFLKTALQAEINRIVREYQGMQLNRAKSDRFTLNSSTLNRSEVLFSVLSVNMIQRQDSLLVRIDIQNGAGEEISIDLPIESA